MFSGDCHSMWVEVTIRLVRKFASRIVKCVLIIKVEARIICFGFFCFFLDLISM